MSSSFIKITDQLNIIDIPTIKNNIPVISCIGTSRDGKSTLLNIYCEWLLSKYNIKNKPKMPFLSEQSDDAITNGIDFYKIENKCLLLDCQGMQLENAKYDHYLALITYLISNVIILTVRQRLDLQVLNNLLGIFSFLSEIPEEFRRTDKPKLIIRIKDFQNIKALKENSNYLDELINKWLEKTDDQYDQIKEAFKITFDIFPIVTLTPKYDNEDNEFDIYSETFNFENPSFKNACDKIFELSQNCNISYLLNDNKKFKNLINKLKENKEIDFRKLDLYHNITNVELLKYLNSHINIEPFIDKTIINEANGCSTYYNAYNKRLKLLNELKNYTYNVKFKNVPLNIKDEIFKETFDNLYKIMDECKEKNEKIAEELVESNLIKYRDVIKEPIENNNLKQYNIELNNMYKYFNILDDIVNIKYTNLLKLEFSEVQKLLSKANELNAQQIKLINNLIDKYDVSNQYINKLNEYIDNIKDNYSGLNDINNIKYFIEENIEKDIQIIITLNNKKHYVYTQINNDQGTMPNIYSIKDDKILEFKYDIIIDKKFPLIIKKKILSTFNKIGILNSTVNSKEFQYIQFLSYKFGSLEPYIMTTEFYNYVFLKNFLPIISSKIFDDIDTNINICYKNEKINNVYIIHYNIIELIQNNLNNNERILRILEDKFLLLLFKFILQHKNNSDNIINEIDTDTEDNEAIVESSESSDSED